MLILISILKFRSFGFQEPRIAMTQSKNRSSVTYLRRICFLFLLVFSGFAQSQDTLTPTRFEPMKIKHRFTKDPVLLSRELTSGLTTQKEKFDAIFTWVVWNIHYNYRFYNSGKAGNSKPNIKRILRRQKGICTDFAFTMDTLCELAGIPNETVTGYAKEIIFDLNDTLYFDNHAWNAVKLNGLWYVYDATWCSGRASYEYTKFSKWLIKTMNRLDKKRKLESYNLVIKNHKPKYCGEEEVTTTYKKVDIWVQPFFPRLFQKILSFFPLRSRMKNVFVANTTYYLTNPEQFSVTHFPNNPNWSLTPKIRNVFEFSADSAYYNRHYTESVRAPREGRFCLDCDNYHYADNITQERITRSRSVMNNPNNHLVPANYSLFMAEVLFKKAVKEEDSLTKMQLIDSTITYLDTCKSELKKSRMACRAEYRAQMSKNKDKRNGLVAENKQHRALSSKILAEINKRRVRVNSLKQKSGYYSSRTKKDLSKFNNAFDKPVNTKKYAPELIAKLKSEVQQLNSKSDSLTAEIRKLQQLFTPNTSDLWGNLLEQQQVLSPLAQEFNLDAYYRHFEDLDNYERLIREIRATIHTYEDSLFVHINTKIVFAADSIYNQFVMISKLTKERNAIHMRLLKLRRSLNSCGQLTNDSLNYFRQAANQLMNEDICWNIDNTKLVKEVVKNFKSFLKASRYFTKVVYRNDAQETSRFNRFNKHILRNKSRVTRAIEGNSGYAPGIRKSAYDHRRSFLNKWRTEHRN